jgi:Mce-associated membrane protein
VKKRAARPKAPDPDMPAGEPSESDGSAGMRKSAARDRDRTVTAVVLATVALFLACGAGYLKYDGGIAAADQRAAGDAVQAATASTVAMLSYSPDTAEATLGAAGDRLTGTFRDSYLSLTKDVVIPGAKQKQISATATVPTAAPVSASAIEGHAVVLVFVDQNVVIGSAPPTQTASVVQVTLDKVDDRWLISGFDPK